MVAEQLKETPPLASMNQMKASNAQRAASRSE